MRAHTQRGSVCLYVCMYVCLSLSLSQTRAHTYARAHTHTHKHIPRRWCSGHGVSGAVCVRQRRRGCMPYMYALYVHALYVCLVCTCLTCMPYMYMPYMYASCDVLYVCLMCTCLICMPSMQLMCTSTSARLYAGERQYVTVCDAISRESARVRDRERERDVGE